MEVIINFVGSDNDIALYKQFPYFLEMHSDMFKGKMSWYIYNLFKNGSVKNVDLHKENRENGINYWN